MAGMTTGGALAVAALSAAVAVGVAVSPIWRRSRAARETSGPGGQPSPPPGRIPPRWREWVSSGDPWLRIWRHRGTARWGPVGASMLCGGAGLLAGPVASGVLAAYGAAGFLLVRGIAVRLSEQRSHRLAADAVVALAADLRAGLALPAAWQAAQEALRQAQASVLPGWRRGTGAVVDTVAGRTVAAIAVAETCGAPLADVLDRVDAHLRAVDRARAVASGQAAGARVSAGLLAAMPVAGAGLGTLVGVDVWRVLLHTPLGAIAVGAAVALQLGGLAWSARLTTVAVTP